MPILNKGAIIKQIDEGELILHPRRDSEGIPVVEPASYDLRAGVVVWKDKASELIQTERYDATKAHQKSVTLLPGQMIFVVTHEELKLPLTVSGTVYSRNRLQKKNILALNAGHVDPGYQGPILIRLINLAAGPWTLELGEPVFTVVFHTVKASEMLEGHSQRTQAETVTAAMEAAAQAFSNPFHDLYRGEIKRQLDEHYATAERNIRLAMSEEFFHKSHVDRLVLTMGAVIVGGAFLVFRMPWDKVWSFLKWVVK